MKVGEIDIHPIADGTFRASPGYFGDHVTAHGHEDFFDRHGQAWMPIGTFLVRTGSSVVLVDTGLGPDLHDDGPERMLVGGQLPVGLRAAGVRPDEIDVVICTHLHLDHCGWLFDLAGRPVFPRADIWFGAADWEHFVLDPRSRMLDHIRHGLLGTDAARLRLVSRDTTVVPGIDVTMTPGHTPGHLSVVVSSGVHRALLLGDAITCPLQLEEPTWHAMGDIDPQLAAQVRERLFRELEGDTTYGAGAHFPELQFGRVMAGEMRRWIG
ncbi:MBL fold metallo-hydrolase [Blastococcus saxobsidens]|uniref:MBL fold metallo-hydrolase n=1 Tax=Blastococcus saxobsidens TaxID=138336 RepID=A0A6L9W0Q9_9ACTN|nr:MBL fold metallo-hydrolase [Blastococcus saxobsidens]NEK85081.1 MBL fold metallo-hydrolase [Blastococcus saxobsidens]